MATPYLLGCDLSIPTYTWSAGVNTSFPVTNLQTYFNADLSKSNATTSDQYLQIDLGSALAVDTVIIDRQNFVQVNPDTSILLQYNSNDDTNWGDAATAVTIQVNGAYSNNTTVKTFGTQTKRYWRIIFTSTCATAPQFGSVFLGTRLTFDSTYEWDFSRANRQYETSETMSINGDIRMSQVFIGRRRFDLTFRLQSDTFKTNWNTFIEIVRGKLRPFYFVDTDANVYYVHLDEDYTDIKTIRYNQNNLKLSLKTQQAY